MSKASAKGAPSGAERRKTRRRPILDTFSLFVVVPKKGVHRLPVHDLSDEGMGFDFDIEGESAADFPVQRGETVDVLLYLNQSLYLPLSVRVVRVEDKGEIRKVGAEFTEKSGPAFQGYAAFLAMLDAVAEAGHIEG